MARTVRKRRNGARWILAGILLVSVMACRPSSPQPVTGPSGDDARSDEITTARLQASIGRSARYLARLCDEQGQFDYRTHLDPDEYVEPRYNVLRHSGAIYALAQYCRRSPEPEVHDAMLRAATFLRKKCIAPVAGNPNLMAVWSEPELVGSPQPRQAKLGGAGLALVALLSVEEVEPGFTPIDELRALGRFLIFMQKPDGSFYSKYFPDAGRSDIWESTYYPGEAALGLLMLDQLVPAPQWSRSADKALAAIARRAAPEQPTFPDQWFLLATERAMQRIETGEAGITGEAILKHARRICRDMLAEQRRQRDNPDIRGCFTSEGRSCPSATRLEGLLAALVFLPADDASLKAEIRESVRVGMQFLLRCQVVSGPHAGAVPRIIPGYKQAPGESDRNRAGEVRIDYIQHALSAMMQFEQEFDDVQKTE